MWLFYNSLTQLTRGLIDEPCLCITITEEPLGPSSALILAGRGRGASARGRSGTSATLSDCTYHYPLLTVARPAPRASRDALAVARRADVFGANLHGTGFTFRAADAKGAGFGPLRACSKLLD